MTVSYRNTASSSWSASATSLSCSIGYTNGATNRKVVAAVVSRTGYPSNAPTHNGTSMTAISGASINAEGWYIKLYELDGFTTGTQTVSCTLGSTHSNCCLFVLVGDSDSAAITIRSTGTNSGQSSTPTLTVSLDSSTTDQCFVFGAAYDTLEYGEGYGLSSGTCTARSAKVDTNGNYTASGGNRAGTSGSTSCTLSSLGDGSVEWAIAGISLSDSGGGGGSTDLTVNNTSNTHSSDGITLTQTHVLAVADTANTHTAENVVLDSNTALVIADSSTSHTSENVVLVENPTLVVAATSTSHASEIFALEQTHQLTVANTATAHTSQNVALGGIPPSGSITAFDCAAGTNALGVRNIAYSGSDTASSGFHIQWRAKVNGGSYGAWTDSGQANALNNWPFQIGGSWNPNDIITVQLRASNDAGDGSASSELSFKLHESWHRTGIKPGYTVGTLLTNSKGYAANGWDVVAPTHYEGTLTVQSGLHDVALFVAHDTSYVQPQGGGQIGWYNDVTYDGINVPKIISHGTVVQETRREGTGGFEAFLETGFSTGAHLLEFDWQNAQSQRSLEFTAVIVERVNQTTPLGGQRLRLWPPGNEANNDGVDDISPLPTDNFGGSTNTRFTLPDVAASYDEFVLSVAGFYGIGGESSGILGYNSFGEAAPGSDWNAGNNSTPRPGSVSNPNGPDTTGLHMFAGDGNVGLQVAISIADFDDCAPSFPLHDQVWRNLTNYTAHWVSAYAIALRPTPEMISSLSVTLATTDQVNWQCATAVNHGRLLVAITLQSDPAPTATQIRNHIDTLSSDYTGAFLGLDTKIPTNGEVSASGGTLTDTFLTTQAPGNYRLSVAYETWQGSLSQYDNLGTAQTANFTITDNTLSISSTATSHASANIALTQVHQLSAANTATSHTTGTVALTQVHQLAVADTATALSSPSFALMEITGTGAGTLEGVRGWGFEPEGFEWRLFDVSADDWTDYTANLVYVAGGPGTGLLTAVTGSGTGSFTYSSGTLEAVTGSGAGTVLTNLVGYGVGALDIITGTGVGLIIESLNLVGTGSGTLEVVSGSAEGRISWVGWLPSEPPLDPNWTPESPV